MKIKFNKTIGYASEESTTLCPHGMKDIWVSSTSCSKCNFFVRPHIFSDAITCSYDKAKKRGQVKEDKVAIHSEPPRKP